MKLKKLKKLIDAVSMGAGDVDVCFYINKDKSETEYEVKEIRQFSFIKDVNVTLKKVK